jgi:3-deoxy-7-phosphoheptulonate synthase
LPSSREFESIVASLSDALDFSRTIGGLSGSAADNVDFYTSHEGLLLDYERAMTRSFPVPGTPDKTANYNTSAHFLWVGDRTRQLDGEHVNYFRTIRNPMGVKVGPTMKDDELVSLLDIVNPDKEIGRVTLITRYGAAKVCVCVCAHLFHF